MIHSSENKSTNFSNVCYCYFNTQQTEQKKKQQNYVLRLRVMACVYKLWFWNLLKSSLCAIWQISWRVTNKMMHSSAMQCTNSDNDISQVKDNGQTVQDVTRQEKWNSHIEPNIKTLCIALHSDKRHPVQWFSGRNEGNEIISARARTHTYRKKNSHKKEYSTHQCVFNDVNLK